jgi:[FeFe] hydrogenase H-cluster maturation GTPase HydF
MERDVIGIFGKMNSGKSSLMNLITQQETSIVDETPGTTADTKITLMEIHGLGPVKLLDTAGFDETDELGDKKRKKVIEAFKECDLILLVINPATTDFEQEYILINEARELDKQLLVICNLFKPEDQNCFGKIESILPELKYFKKKNVSVIDRSKRQEVLQFILENYISRNSNVDLLPFIEKDEFYILNIPMDEETPPGRFLRPQSMAEEFITRHWAFPVSYRMNLSKARAGDRIERQRWEQFLASFTKLPKAIITDSQAIDILKDWAPEKTILTTFSIMMVNYMSRGRLSTFVKGVKEINSLKSGDKILIAEACNHSRIKEDIGTVQIPRLLLKKYPGVLIEHSFGRDLSDEEELKTYKLVIHCGGCMISSQKMAARLRDLENSGTPITNYGVILSFFQGENILKRVTQPWLENS